MARTKKLLPTKPYRGTGFAILNAYGAFWSMKVWDTAEEAQAYMTGWAKKNSIPLPNHTVIPARVTISAIRRRSKP